MTAGAAFTHWNGYTAQYKQVLNQSVEGSDPTAIM